MRLYELQRASLENDLDQQLKGVAGGIDDAQNQPEMPEGGLPQGEEPNDEPDVKPVDASMFAAFKSLPYVTKWKFDDENKTHPMRIMTMGLDELSNLQNMVRAKMQLATTQGNPGSYDSPDMEYYQDLLSFVEKVLAYRKQHDERDIPSQSAPDVQKQPTPKNAAGTWGK